MPHIIDEQADAPWKVQLRERIESNLDTMIQDAHVAYKRKAIEVSFASTDVRYRLELDYKQDVQNLRHMAKEELRAEIEREEQERKWIPWQSPEGVDQAIIEEQLVILNQIRNSPTRVHRVAVEEYNGSFFQQGSSCRPFYELHSPVRERSGSNAGTTCNYFSPHSSSANKMESPAEKEARLRTEKHEKQQEEFRKRAEAIQERKRRERQSISWTENMSSSSSTTSASDQEPTTPFKSVPGAAPMTEEDIINLTIFHDQQWTFISSLPHLQWTDFPWPVLSFSSPKSKDDLTVETVVEYVLAPLTVNHDRAVVKDRSKDLIRRWHPDRFETKYLALIADLREREMVREGAGIVARILNDLLGRWNDV